MSKVERPALRRSVQFPAMPKSGKPRSAQSNRVDGDQPWSRYTTPIKNILNAMATAGLNKLLEIPAFSCVDVDSIRTVMTGFASIAEGVIAPSDRHR